jgi:hypothetical protein
MSVPKRRHIKFGRRGITQKKAYSLQNTAKFEIKKSCVCPPLAGVWRNGGKFYFFLTSSLYQTAVRGQFHVPALLRVDV